MKKIIKFGLSVIMSVAMMVSPVLAAAPNPAPATPSTATTTTLDAATLTTLNTLGIDPAALVAMGIDPTTFVAMLNAQTAMTTAPATPAVATPSVPAVTTVKNVYVSSAGKYHSDPHCSGMKHYTTMTKEQAINSHYTPCSKCGNK